MNKQFLLISYSFPCKNLSLFEKIKSWYFIRFDTIVSEKVRGFVVVITVFLFYMYKWFVETLGNFYVDFVS